MDGEFAARLVPPDQDQVLVRLDDREVLLTNLRKVFWPEEGYTKGDLIRYYLTLAPVILPHVRDRPMTLKRYPDGIHGSHFFMKRVPRDAPAWIRTCEVPTDEPERLLAPMVQDVATLLWVINLGCIDLNPTFWRCDAIDYPDYLHFDLDPTPGTTFGQIRQAALLIKRGLDGLGMPSYAKSTGGRGIHVFVPIARGPSQDEVWCFAKAFAHSLARVFPDLLTVQYAVKKRPPGRVHIDYNQNSWGRTLASVYSVRPAPGAPVSMPVTWDEVSRGFEILDFRMSNAADRVRRFGDLWAPVDAPSGRFDLVPLLGSGRVAPGRRRLPSRPGPGPSGDAVP